MIIKSGLVYFGPFKSIELQGDVLHCDGVNYPINALDNYELLEDYELPAQPVVVTVPEIVTMRQARLVLLGAGLLNLVDVKINELPSPQKEAARIEWDYSSEVQRHRGLVVTLGGMLGLTEPQLDELFIAASKIA